MTSLTHTLSSLSEKLLPCPFCGRDDGSPFPIRRATEEVMALTFIQRIGWRIMTLGMRVAGITGADLVREQVSENGCFYSNRIYISLGGPKAPQKKGRQP